MKVPHEIQVQQLKGFIAVAKYKSFSKAAKMTSRTQPAVSLQIAEIEKKFKTRLFYRLGAKHIELTTEGKTLYELTAPLLEELEGIDGKFEEARGKGGKGTLRIATHTSVMTHLLPDVIKKFRMRFPDCALTIVNRGKTEILEMVKNGEADIGICSLSNVPPTIDYQVFACFNRLLITAKDHPLAKKAQISPKDIAQYPIIVPPEGSNTRKKINEVFEKDGLAMNIAMEVNGREAVKTYVKDGLGVSIINEYYLTKEDRKKLFCTDVSQYFGKAERGLVTRKNKYQTKTLVEFIKIISNLPLAL